MTKAKQILQDFTAEVVNSMINNNDNWQKMFGDQSNSKNALTGKNYRGFNWLVLSFETQEKKFKHNIWATYKQWLSLDAQVKKGSKGTGIVYYQPALFRKPKENEKPNTKDGSVKVQSNIMRASTVFNLDQVELSNKSTFKVPQLNSGKQYSINHIDKFIDGVDVEIINEDNNNCYYNETKDIINMASKETFKDTRDADATEHYYATFFHELTHATKHAKRLNRKAKFENDAHKSYAFEELVAELGAIMFTRHFGIAKTIRENHAQYLNSWIKALKNDYTFLTGAVAKANQGFSFYVK